MTEPDKLNPEMKGWLLKWGNYVTGFQRRWFVLSNGALSYYHDRDDINQECRGTIPLHVAQINEDVQHYAFAVSNGGAKLYHLKASSVDEYNSWITALKTAKWSVLKGMESEEEDETSEVEPEKQGWLYANTSLLGLKQYWFVLSNGVLKYYHNRIEKNPNWKIIPLHNAEINTTNFCEFYISINGGDRTFFKTTSAEEREQWVTALKSSQAKVGAQSKKEVEKVPISLSVGSQFEKEGWLYKVNFWRGYVQYWFVLSNGVLKYCNNRIEQDPKWKAVSLHNAKINTVDFCDFSITFINDTGNMYLKAKSSEERGEWVNALNLSQANAKGAAGSEINVPRATPQETPDQKANALNLSQANAIGAAGNEINLPRATPQETPDQKANTIIIDLTERLENLRVCNALNTKNGNALQHALNDLDTNDSQNVKNLTKDIIENAKLFSMSSDAMIKACNEYLRTAESQDRNWLQDRRKLQQEREQRLMLEKVVEQLMNQQEQLKIQTS